MIVIIVTFIILIAIVIAGLYFSKNILTESMKIKILDNHKIDYTIRRSKRNKITINQPNRQSKYSSA